MKIFLLILSVLFSILQSCSSISLADDKVIRIGHFPNLTHAHALIAHNSTRGGKGLFEKSVGENTKIEWFTYNAGPSAMEALMIGAIDFAYVGPNPALNAFSRTKGEEVRVLAGATYGGSALVVQGDGSIKESKDFKGKKIATPQLGNTQDIAARSWLIANGINVSLSGGDAFIIPTENPDQLELFKAHKLDAVWTVEPWVSRLEKEANGKVFLEEKDSITTIFVASSKIIKEQPKLVTAILSAHNELSSWISTNPSEAKAQVRAELEAETSRAISNELVDSAWTRLQFSSQLSPDRFNKFVSSAKQVGFLKDIGDFSSFFYAPK